ncbi:MAG: glycosyltransferase [Chitinophagaceae bacterium]|nr:MAG: glycosyltransferase [Chitinophagaceae bacterium]
MQKIFGVVILYFPDQTIIDNIKSYIRFVEKLIVIDNSSPASTIDFNFSNKIILIQNNDNLGIAAPLNQAIELCKQSQADWLLTMDQDSQFLTGEMEKYLNCISNFKDIQQVGMFGLNYLNANQIKECVYTETDEIITSGSLVNLKIAEQIGGFDEKLFIDEVDSEYCYRINKYGFKTIRFDHVHLHHHLGTSGQYRSYKTGKVTSRSLHSHIRIYYMVRNYLYVFQQYKNIFPQSFPKRKKALLNRIKNKFLYGDQKWKLLTYLFKAYTDYRKGQMGKWKN